MKKIFLIITIILSLALSGCTFFQKDNFISPDAKNGASSYEESPLVDPKNLEAKVPILIYHHIREATTTDAEKNKQFILSPADFEHQLQYLKDNNFETISLADLNNYFAGQFSLPQKPVIITFDDGLISQYTNALPLLQKYNFTATFFIFTNPIGKSKNYLTWEQLKELDKLGMEIGVHGKYHLYLNKEKDQKKLAAEILGSKEKVEEELGKKISTFSYPFGAYNDQVIEMVKNAGYTSARDIINGVSHKKANLYKLKAYFITDSFPRFTKIVGQ